MTIDRARCWLAETQMDLMAYRFRVTAGLPIHGMYRDLTVKRAAWEAQQLVHQLEAAQKAEAA